MSCRPAQFILQPFPMSVTNCALILPTSQQTEIIKLVSIYIQIYIYIPYLPLHSHLLFPEQSSYLFDDR